MIVRREEKVLVQGGTFPRYAAAGFLVFLRQGTLFAARFSPERVELLGPPVPVLEDVGFAETYGNGQFSFSETGLLTYLPDPNRARAKAPAPTPAATDRPAVT